MLRVVKLLFVIKGLPEMVLLPHHPLFTTVALSLSPSHIHPVHSNRMIVIQCNYDLLSSMLKMIQQEPLRTLFKPFKSKWKVLCSSINRSASGNTGPGKVNLQTQQRHKSCLEGENFFHCVQSQSDYQLLLTQQLTRLNKFNNKQWGIFLFHD